MDTRTKYERVFKDVFPEHEGAFGEDFTFSSVDEWDSLTHMELISRLEEAFGIMFETNDILHFESFDNGLKILEHYGVK